MSAPVTFPTVASFLAALGAASRPPHGTAVHRLEDLHREARTSPPFRTGYHAVVLVTAGAGTNTIDGLTCGVCPGTFYFTNPAHLKSYWMSEALRGYIVMFDPEFLRATPGSSPERDFPFLFRATTPSMQLPGTEVAAVERLYGGLLATIGFDADVATRTAMLRAQLHSLLFATAALIDKYAAPSIAPTRDTELVDRFRAELERAVLKMLSGRGDAGRPTVASFAARLFITPDHLSAVVKQVTGLSPKQHVDRRIATEAAAMLRDTSEPVSAIAAKLGFADASNFARFVKRGFGVSPSKLRADAPNPSPRPEVPG